MDSTEVERIRLAAEYDLENYGPYSCRTIEQQKLNMMAEKLLSPVLRLEPITDDNMIKRRHMEILNSIGVHIGILCYDRIVLREGLDRLVLDFHLGPSITAIIETDRAVVAGLIWG